MELTHLGKADVLDNAAHKVEVQTPNGFPRVVAHGYVQGRHPPKCNASIRKSRPLVNREAPNAVVRLKYYVLACKFGPVDL